MWRSRYCRTVSRCRQEIALAEIDPSRSESCLRTRCVRTGAVIRPGSGLPASARSNARSSSGHSAQQRRIRRRVPAAECRGRGDDEILPHVAMLDERVRGGSDRYLIPPRTLIAVTLQAVE